jgi:hypothetical protein
VAAGFNSDLRVVFFALVQHLASDGTDRFDPGSTLLVMVTAVMSRFDHTLLALIVPLGPGGVRWFAICHQVRLLKIVELCPSHKHSNEWARLGK